MEMFQLRSGLNQTEWADKIGVDRSDASAYITGRRDTGEIVARRYWEAMTAARMPAPEDWDVLVHAKPTEHTQRLEARLLELEEQAATRETEYQAQALAVADLSGEAERLDALVVALTVRVERLEGGASQKQGGSS